MVAISMFGAIFTWLMIFITHIFFRRREGEPKVWGSPWTSLLGAGLMAAILITTAFTAEFRMTLVCGVPLLIVLTLFWKLRPQPVP